MSDKERVRIWVAPNFAKILKANASYENKAIIDYTQDLTPDMDAIFNKRRKQMKQNEKKYEFKF